MENTCTFYSLESILSCKKNTFWNEQKYQSYRSILKVTSNRMESFNDHFADKSLFDQIFPGSDYFIIIRSFNIGFARLYMMSALIKNWMNSIQFDRTIPVPCFGYSQKSNTMESYYYISLNIVNDSVKFYYSCAKFGPSDPWIWDNDPFESQLPVTHFYKVISKNTNYESRGIFEIYPNFINLLRGRLLSVGILWHIFRWL